MKTMTVLVLACVVVWSNHNRADEMKPNTVVHVRCEAPKENATFLSDCGQNLAAYCKGLKPVIVNKADARMSAPGIEPMWLEFDAQCLKGVPM